MKRFCVLVRRRQKTKFCRTIIQILLPSGSANICAVMFATPNSLSVPLVVEKSSSETEQKNRTVGSTDAASDEEFLYKLPFSSQTYFMMRPIENFHIYLWIMKDLAWAQDWYYPAMIFGILALAWCGMIMYEAWEMRSWYEAYMCIATTLWLAANFVWMAGTYHRRCIHFSYLPLNCYALNCQLHTSFSLQVKFLITTMMV